MTAATTKLLTAEEFLKLEDGRRSELVRGEVVPVNVPGSRHGRITGRIARLLSRFLDVHDVGELYTNDAGFITGRRPDSVRGPDISFYSYERMPRGQAPVGYPSVAPDVIFEVRSPDDRWPGLLSKVAECLEAGVTVAVILDPDTRTAHVYLQDQPVQVLSGGSGLPLPGVLQKWQVRVEEFFA